MTASRYALAAALFPLLAAQPAQPPPTLPEGVRAERNLVYARTPQKELLLDLYLPAGATPLPVILWVHGGAWRSGSKEPCPAVRQSGRGYAVACISYRLSQEALFPAQIEDVKAAVGWLRANAAKHNLDANRIGAWGASAGGHLVALLGSSADDPATRVQAVVDFFGPTDFLRMRDFPGKMDHDAPDSPESRLIGGAIQQNKEKVARANPITYVSRDDPPFLIMHGDQDPLVPLNQSELLHTALTKAGVESTLHVVKGAGHGFGGPEIDARVNAFFDRHLKAAAQPPPAAWLDPNKSEPAGTRYRTFFSRTIGAEASYLIYLPPDYEQSGRRRYPVVYWLHGLGGDQRGGARSFLPHLDAAIRAGKAPAMIAVLVNGMRDSMYCDFRDGTLRVESVIVKDLIPHVDASCRTIARRRGRAVEGYSMGGFGAAHLGFKYPELFGAVSIMAGALHDAESLRERRPDLFQRRFGGDKAYYDANSPWILIEKNVKAVRGRTFVRIAVGAEDQLLERNRAYHELLDRLKIAHEYEAVPGVAHNGGKFYAVLGERALAFYRRAFGK